MKYRLLFITLFTQAYLPCLAQEVRLSMFRAQGEGISWSPDGKQVLYDMKGVKPNEYYEIHIADTNGNHDTCVSALNPDIPHRHTGSPNWHPSGNYIMFVAEQAQHPEGSGVAIPGIGSYTDIWIMTRDYKHAYKMTNTPQDNDHGIIGPQFSHDGKHVVWVERKQAINLLKMKQVFGYWVIRTADFVVENGIPKFENEKTFEPGGTAFYETYGFSADDKRIIFCSDFNVDAWWSCGIFTIDANTGGDVRQLTTNDYNEHAVCSPDGKCIVWMSNTMATRAGTDWWMMKPDGSCKQRLTFFNEPGNPEYDGNKKWTGLVTFSPDCKHFMGGAQNSLLKQEGSIYRVDIQPSGDGNGLTGEYYSNQQFSGDKKTRTDPSIDYRWGPPWHDTLVTSKDYSVRWTGYIDPLYSEQYTFYSQNDRNLSVWINDTLVIKAGTPKNKYDEENATVNMQAGKKYKLKVEYHNNLQNKSTVSLYWSSEHQYKQPLPASQLYTNN